MMLMLLVMLLLLLKKAQLLFGGIQRDRQAGALRLHVLAAGPPGGCL